MTEGQAVLGLSFDYHDAAAAVVVDGELVNAAAEERFSRVKHDSSLPEAALAWCLENAAVGSDGLAGVAFYGKPLTTYERIITTHAGVGPVGVRSLAQAAATWSRSKLWVRYRIERALRSLGYAMPPMWFAEHHQSHAAAAFLPSPFERAAVLTFDGVGEWTTTSLGIGESNRVDLVEEIRFPDSIGLLYSTITAMCGFAVNDGEAKVMGLAPYGEPRFAEVLRDNVVHMGVDGSIRLNPRYFAYRSGERMAHPRLYPLLGGPPRGPDDPLGSREADLAASIQVVVEEIVLAVARHAAELTGETRAVLAGGVALNCVANSRLLEDGPFDEIWVQPAAGDDGGAVGAALWGWHQVLGHPRSVAEGRDAMKAAALGPGFAHEEVAAWLRDNDVPFEEFENADSLNERVSAELEAGSVVGWFEGRMEFGPRALGHRSILADPRDPTMVSRINSAVKRREGFRPFAPAVRAEDAVDWFGLDHLSPYMLFTASVRHAEVDRGPAGGDDFADRLDRPRSPISACTHVDGSARVQTVDALTNPAFHALLTAFDRRTGCPVLLNTSFNGPDEPIVLSPADALRCFVETGLDLVVLERCIVDRRHVTVESR